MLRCMITNSMDITSYITKYEVLGKCDLQIREDGKVWFIKDPKSRILPVYVAQTVH